MVAYVFQLTAHVDSQEMNWFSMRLECLSQQLIGFKS